MGHLALVPDLPEPAAGAHGELTGILLIRALLEKVPEVEIVAEAGYTVTAVDLQLGLELRQPLLAAAAQQRAATGQHDAGRQKLLES